MSHLTHDQFETYEWSSCLWVSPKEATDKIYHHQLNGALSYSYMSIGVVFKEFRTKKEFEEYVLFKNKFSQHPTIEYIGKLPSSFFEHPMSEQDVERWLWYVQQTLATFNTLIVKDTPQERTNFLSHPAVVQSWPTYEDFWYYRVKDTYSNMAFQYEPNVFKSIGEDGEDFVGYIYKEDIDSIYLFAHFAIHALQRMQKFIEQHDYKEYDFWMHIAETKYFDGLFGLKK